MKRLEHVSCAKRLRELGLSRMEKVLWGELINVCKCLKGQCNEDRTETGSSQRCTVPQPEAMGPDSKPPNTGGFLWTSGHTFSLWGWLSTATSCPERLAVCILGVTHKPAGHGSGQVALGVPVCFPRNLPAMITIMANFCALFNKEVVHKDVGIYIGGWPDMPRERRQVRILEQELLLADDISLVNEWQSGKRPNTSKAWAKWSMVGW